MDDPFWLRLWRLRERLWAKPMAYAVLAVAAALLAQMADGLGPPGGLPDITAETIDKLLTVLASSMLAIATFAVGSMVQAYANATQTATPRALPLVVGSGSAQTALSVYVAAFIFSIVGLVALRVGIYGQLGRLALFGLTLGVFAWVIGTFVRWVDDIARLGMMGNTIDRVETAACRTLVHLAQDPFMGGVPAAGTAPPAGLPVMPGRLGHVQLVHMERLQEVAARCGARVSLAVLPGAFVGPGEPVLHVEAPAPPAEEDLAALRKAVVIGDDRTFEADPRFGLIVLSEIAVRALSPGVNDPGTAIIVLGRMVRLFAAFHEARGPAPAPRHDRVAVPALALPDLFDNAFTAIGRDGAPHVEVAERLQSALASIARLPLPGIAREAQRHSALALARARDRMRQPEDLARVEAAAPR